MLVVEESGGALVILDRSGRLRSRIALGLRPHELAVTADGSTAFVPMFGIADYNNSLGVPGTTVAVIDLARGVEKGRMTLPQSLSAPHGAALRPGTDELFVNAEVPADVMVVFSTTGAKPIRQFPIPVRTHNFIFDTAGDTLFSFAGARGVSRIDARDGRILAHADIGSPARGVRLLGRDELAVAGKGEVVILDRSTLAERRRLKAPVTGQFAYLDVESDGTIAAPSLSDNGVVLFSPQSPPRFIATGKTALTARFSPWGDLVVANVLDSHLSYLRRSAAARDTMIATSFGKVSGPNGVSFGRCPLGSP